ncbi:MAG: glycoprotein [Udune virus]|uniref:Envelopment polyprotein n=1 Tax=Udune virus TaxID=2800946 RepID=A0A894KKL5_9VIRU|nr:MAG: glycoprotein [Udune virus]
MWKLLLLLIIALIGVDAKSARRHCLANIDASETYLTRHAISDACITDDISRIHVYQDVENFYPNKTTVYRTTIRRKFFQKDWQSCKPELNEQGPLSILRINPDATMHIEQHACSSSCNIQLDKSEGTIILESPTSNFYEIDGKQTIRGWFKFKQVVELSSTCDQITIKCGQQLQILKVCFNENFSCMKMFRQYWLPEKFGRAFCQNIELIILMSIIIISFIIVKILLKTYLVFLLFPFYYPMCYVLSLFQSKICASCKICGQTYHPFTKCSLTCACGATFMSTQELWQHRKTLSCPGPKISVKAIKMCKSQSINFTMVIMLCVMLSSLISPVKAYDLEELQPWLKKEKMIQKTHLLYYDSALSLLITIFSMLVVSSFFVLKKIFQKSYPKCKMCMCYHKRDLSCNWCICGRSTIVSDSEIKLKSNVMTLAHVGDDRCIQSYTALKYQRFAMAKGLIIMILALAITVSPAFANPYAQCAANQKTPEQTYPYYLAKCEIPSITLDANDITLLKDLTKFDNDRFCEIESKLAKMACDTTTREKFRIELYKIMNSVEEIILNTSMCAQMNLTICAAFYNEKTNFTCRFIRQQDRETLEKNLDFAMQLLLAGFGGQIKYHPELTEKPVEEVFTKFFRKLPYNARYPKIYNFKKAAIQIRQLKLLLDMNKNTDILYITTTGGYISTNLDKTTTNYTCEVITTKPRQQTPPNPVKETPKPEKPTAEPEGQGQSMTTPFSHEQEERNMTMPSGSKPGILQKSDDGMDEIRYDQDEDEGMFDILVPSDDGFLTKTGFGHASNRKVAQCVVTGSYKCKKKKNKGITETLAVCNGAGLYKQPYSFHSCKSIDIGCFCYNKECTQEQPEIDPTEYVECESAGSATIIKTPKMLVHDNILEYTKQLQHETIDDLTIHAFKKTAYSPKIKPSYTPVTIQGQETAEGMMNSYITGIIPAIEGKSTGFRIYAPNTRNELMNVILTVSKARTKAEYRSLYTTGPTRTINVKYAELCTGRCPKTIPKAGKGYLTFSKESTSQWGCEAYGCLAIGEGCVYGSCMDVIDNEFEIYKKKYETKKEVEVCVIMSEESYCKEVNIDEPIETEKLELAFQTQEIDELPELIAIRKGKIYTGEIADLGAFGSGCGSIQKIRHLTFGTGTPEWSYFCHAATNKDIVIRKCAINNYQACQHLTKRDDLSMSHFRLETKKNAPEESISELLDAKDIKQFYNESYYWGNIDIEKNMHSIGFINFKLMLGDVNYKTYKEKVSFDMTGSCAGCIDCAEDISCDIEITSEYEASCKIHAADCVPYTERILVKPGITQHGLKFKCISNNTKIHLEICDQLFGPKVTIVQPARIDIDSDGQTAYIVQKNEECATWLCKVMKEGTFGIGALLNPFASIKSFFSWIGMIILFILTGLFVYFVGIPMTKKFVDFLKKKEIEYQRLRAKNE